jgi:hypothetical protein
LVAVEPDLGCGDGGLAGSEDGFAGLAFDAMPDCFAAGLEAASPGLGVATGVALAFTGAAGAAGAFDDAAPDFVLPAGAGDAAFGADSSLEGLPVGLPAGAGDVFIGADGLETIEVSETSNVCGGVLLDAGLSDGYVLISPRYNFSRSARAFDRPFLSSPAS